jgi:putative endonuclease
MTQQQLGIFGEKIAEKYVTEKGYLILNRNFRFGKNEIDLVTEFSGKLIVIEVKTRQTAEIGEPWRSVTRAKQRQIIRVANFYIHEFNVHLETQFDVISIVHNSFRTNIEHIESAFTPGL